MEPRSRVARVPGGPSLEREVVWVHKGSLPKHAEDRLDKRMQET